MFERESPVKDGLRFRLDGNEVIAQRGETFAEALLAAGEAVLSRSPKLHRPRGAACLRGDCEGCLLRIDGEPNLMSCRVPARAGAELSAQNVLGSRETDLLRVTDWFFPKGIDHHHLFAGVPGVETVMQTFARQMAGIGQLPDRVRKAEPAQLLAAEVLVIGAGLSGLLVAQALQKAGRDVRVVEETQRAGGFSALADQRAKTLVAQAHASLGDRVLLQHTAYGVFDPGVLLGSPNGGLLAQHQRLVLATGAHDPTLLVTGADLPGVMGARAVLSLLARGILPRHPLVIVGDHPQGDALEATLSGLGPARVAARVGESEIAEIEGFTQVKAVVLRDKRRIPTEIVAVATLPAPAFELGVQAGLVATHRAGGFPLPAGGGRVFAVGECHGVPYQTQALLEDAERCAALVLDSF